MPDRTQAFEIHAAKQLWHAARPVDAMKALASVGCDEGQRRYHLTSWGVSADDAIDFASDSYIAEPASGETELDYAAVDAYIRAALHAYEAAADFTDSTQLGDRAEENGNYVIGWHDSTLAQFREDVSDFVEQNWALVADLDAGQVGHDFWLTRNGHGAGFWDGDYAHETGNLLTDAAHAYGPCDLYLGDDGWVYAN